MTAPFVSPNGAPAPGGGTFPMPPGQAAFNAPVPVQPAQVIQDRGWQGYPASQIPPMPAPPAAPTPSAFPGQPVPGYPAAPPAQWQPGMPVPTQHAQPSTQPGQQYQQPGQPQAVPGVDLNFVLQGPGFPQELQGVTLGQAIQMYGGMRQLVTEMQRRQQAATPAPASAPAPQPSATPAPAPGTQPPAFDWRNPGPSLAAVIGPMLEQALDRRLAPVTQQAAVQAAGMARNAVVQEIGPQRFAQIEATVMQYLSGATAEDLANPEIWRVATRTALGDQVLRGGQALGGRPPQIPGATPFQPGTPNPAPPLHTFFTEQPQAGGQAVQGVTLTPTQMWFADQMGVPYDTYAAYAQGIPPVLPTNGGRR